jgi:hypothetical protein
VLQVVKQLQRASLPTTMSCLVQGWIARIGRPDAFAVRSQCRATCECVTLSMMVLFYQCPMHCAHSRLIRRRFATTVKPCVCACVKLEKQTD